MNLDRPLKLYTLAQLQSKDVRACHACRRRGGDFGSHVDVSTVICTELSFRRRLVQRECVELVSPVHRGRDKLRMLSDLRCSGRTVIRLGSRLLHELGASICAGQLLTDLRMSRLLAVVITLLFSEPKSPSPRSLK